MKDRPDGYGGVALYIKKTLMPRVCSFPNIHKVECVWVKICIHKYNLIIGSMYRVPHAPASYFESMLQQIEATRDASDELVLMGDFNIDVQRENCDSNYYPTV